MNVLNNTVNRNVNNNYCNVRKINFQGNPEEDIIQKIQTMPRGTFEERRAFLAYCNNVEKTPGIVKAVYDRLEGVEQEAAANYSMYVCRVFDRSNAAIGVLDDCDSALRRGDQLSEEEMFAISEIASDTRLPEYVRNRAQRILSNGTQKD